MDRDRPAQIERDMPLYLKRVAERFDEDVEAIVEAFVKGVMAAPDPPSVFHYTTANVLEGILTSGNLWLSDIFTLNDTAELVYAMQTAVSIVRENPEDEVIRILSEKLEHFTSIESAKSVAAYFVCSFATNGDDLPQWQLYADGGRGYCLEFDTATLEGGFAKQDGVVIENNSTFRVTYSEEELRALVREIVGHIARKVAFLRRVMPDTEAAATGAVPPVGYSTIHFGRLLRRTYFVKTWAADAYDLLGLAILAISIFVFLISRVIKRRDAIERDF